MDWPAALLPLLAAYLVGAVPFGFLVARARGVDIFAAGSGNIGATNVGRVLGRRFGALVFALDCAKGALPVAGALFVKATFINEGGVWARGWLAPHHPRLTRYGIKRLVRDVFQISGSVRRSESGQIVEIVLNQAAPLAAGLVAALRVLLTPEGIAVTLGEN